MFVFQILVYIYTTSFDNNERNKVGGKGKENGEYRKKKKEI